MQRAQDRQKEEVRCAISRYGSPLALKRCPMIDQMENQIKRKDHRDTVTTVSYASNRKCVMPSWNPSAGILPSCVNSDLSNPARKQDSKHLKTGEAVLTI
jgi:hypothetical protein